MKKIHKIVSINGFIHILSDEKIKVGDWFITPGSQLRLRTSVIQPVKADKKVIVTIYG